MAFEHKPGSFSLFKNKYKKADNHPDYKGDGKDLDGNPIEVAAWLKDGQNGKYMSCKISPPRERRQSQDMPPTPPPDFDDQIPF